MELILVPLVYLQELNCAVYAKFHVYDGDLETFTGNMSCVAPDKHNSANNLI